MKRRLRQTVQPDGPRCYVLPQDSTGFQQIQILAEVDVHRRDLLGSIQVDAANADEVFNLMSRPKISASLSL